MVTTAYLAAEAQRLLHDMSVCVREEVSSGSDEPLSENVARGIAAALLVGMRNRGWIMDKMLLRNEEVTYGDERAATVEQVTAYLNGNAD